MRLQKQHLVHIGLAVALTNWMAFGHGAEAHMYRCVDSKSHVYYSDRLGPECHDAQQDRMTRHGLILDRPLDAARPGETSEQLRERLADERHDRALRATYTSEEQIEAAKQRSLQSPMLAVKYARKKLNIYVERLADLQQREATLVDNNSAVPDSLTEDIAAAQTDVVRLERELESKQQRVDRIIDRFDSDKQRYRELNTRAQNR